MTEPVARLLKTGYADKGLLEQELITMARRPLHERVFANYYANPGSRIDPEKLPISRYFKRIARTEDASMTPISAWYEVLEGCTAEGMMTIPVMQPDMTAILITGDSARNKIQIMPGGGYSTIKIELPSNWDDLMHEAGY